MDIINFNEGYSYKIMKLHGLIFALEESLILSQI